MINNPDLENTQKTFDSVISLVPDAPHGYYSSAISNYLKGNYTTAKKNILKAEEFIDDYFFRPDRKNILTLKGKILFKLNDNEGIKILENNLINMIKDAEANYILGTYYFDLGKPKKASKYINKAHILGYNIDPPLDTLLEN